jgi:hypothetical protein
MRDIPYDAGQANEDDRFPDPATASAIGEDDR